MNDTPTPRDCEHGQLSRSCEICELKRDLSAAQERVRYIVALMDEAMQDNDKGAPAEATARTFVKRFKDAESALARVSEERDAAVKDTTEAILAHWYQKDPAGCAGYCDEVLDRSGALLGRVRSSAIAAREGK